MARDGSGPFGTLEALKSDPSSSAAILDDVAAGMLASCPNDKQLASARFVAAVMASPHLIAQLWRVSEIQFRARTAFADYVSRSGQPEGAAKEPLPQGHICRADPETISVGGHVTAARSGLADGAPNAEPINGGGHLTRANSATVEAPPTVDPKSSDGRGSVAAKAITAMPSARPQSAARVIARAEAAGAVRTLYDSYTVQGRPIGDIRFYEIEQLRSASAQEAAVLRQIQRHCQPESPGQLVRDALKLSDLERFVQRGAEVADAA